MTHCLKMIDASEYVYLQGDRQLIVSQIEENGLRTMTIDQIRAWCIAHSRNKKSDHVDWEREGF